MADDGYIGEAPARVKCPASGANLSDNLAEQSRVRSRNEMLNGRFKCWEILKNPFCHNITDHGDVFWAIAVTKQLAIDEGYKLFQVEYSN